MSKAPFRFKQFSIVQENSAMKIGTDGVLLGAWTNTESPQKILDVGTGTGLILLMLAQRFPEAQLTGIEIDINAFYEAEFNINKSKFNSRCSIFHSSVQNFKSLEKYNLIVSNPPFFERTHTENSSRNTARQQAELTFEELIHYSEKLLTLNGKISVIIPIESESHFIELAAKLNLFPQKITRVKGNERATFKRSLLLFSRNESTPQIDELIIEISRNVYTENYINLTKDFYLKM